MKIESDSLHPSDEIEASTEQPLGWERVWAETRARSKPDSMEQISEMERRVFSTIHASNGPAVSSLGMRLGFGSKFRSVYRFGIATIGTLAIILAVAIGVNSKHTTRHTSLVTIVSQLGAASPHTFQLPDGSDVTLSPGTRVEFVASASSVRNFNVDGEAFFNVQHKSHHPFQVKVGPSIVRVLGTSFNVRKFASDNQTTVAVLNGKVEMDRTILSSGDVRTLYSDGRSEYRHDQDITRLTSWKTGRMHFSGAPLGTVVQEIGRWYGMKFIVNNEQTASIPLTLTLNNEPLETLLISIQQTAGVSFDRNGNQVTVISNQLND